MFDTITHRWLRVPYTLNARVIKSARKPVATVLFIHGIGNSGSVWDEVIKHLSPDIRAVTIDLLGFGQSPHPSWEVYGVKTQARSVLATFFALRLRGPVIIVGHSLGALVAVEIARRYPLLVRSLILCSPPFYNLHDDEKKFLPRGDIVLRNIYKTASNHPEQFLQVASVAMRYKLINNVFSVTKDTIDSYMSALEAAIINQTSFDDVKKLKLPIQIIRGTLDPIVVVRNIDELTKARENIRVSAVLSGHEVKGRMIKATAEAVQQAVHGTL